MRKAFFIFLLVLPIVLRAEEITVAAASDLNFVFKDIAARFEKKTSNQVKLSFGSSGNFYSQIQNGAPYDLFFSADIDYPKTLQAVGLTQPGSIYPYAPGKLVLWTQTDSKRDVHVGLTCLLTPR